MIKKKILDNDNKLPNSYEIEKLKMHFPQYFNLEGEFKIEEFNQLLKSNKVTLNKENHELNFLGKSYAKYLTSLNQNTIIVPDTEHNQKNESSDNLYLIGDNLEALRHLLNSYSNQVNCIYIDPPYNTGGDDFVYPDNFEFTFEEMQDVLGIEETEAGKILNLVGKSTHSAWLTFMYPRLTLARDLLHDQGVIFISIDDNEQANLKLLCDSIYGEENFIAQLTVASNSTKNNSKHISVSHEYVLVYAKNSEKLVDNWKVKKNNVNEYVKRTNQLLSRNLSYEEIHTELLELVKYPRFYDFDHYTYVDEKGIFQTDNAGGVENGNRDFEIIHPITKKPCKKPSSGWRYKDDEIERMLKNNEFSFGEDEKTIPRPKRYLMDYLEQVPKSTLFFDSQSSTKWLKANGLPFDFAKPVELIEYIISMVPNCELVLDFFSGSATTAHAVMNLNAKHNKNIKYILVQLPEPIHESKLAYKKGFRTIDQLGRKRIEKAGNEIANSNLNRDNLDLGYKAYEFKILENKTFENLVEFDPSELLFPENMIDIYTTNNISGRDIILSTWANEDGYGLNPIIEEVKLNGYKASLIEQTLYLIDLGLSSDDIKVLISKVEKFELNISRIVTYAFSLEFNITHELKKNIRNLEHKNIKVIERY